MKQPKPLPQTKPTTKIPEKKPQTNTQKKNSQTKKQKKETKRPGKKTKEAKKSGTPYDDAFHTLLKSCSPLILPILNEMFREHYTGKEQITFLSEHYQMNQRDGKNQQRTTDSTFIVNSAGTVQKHYLLEAQSTIDNSMVIRIFEYSTQAALDAKELSGDTLHVTIPQCGILYFRSNRKTPDQMHIHIDTPGGEVTFDVQVLKTQQYTIDELFEKNLLMLIPFHIFSHEKELKEYNTKEEKLRELETEYAAVIDRLKYLKENGQLTEYQYRMLLDMSRTVLVNLATKYDNVKGLEEIMGGNFIETEASRIFREGENRKSRQTTINLYSMGLSPEEIASAVEVDITQVQQWIRNSSAMKL